VVILVREDSWISITADGKPIIEETLVAEDQRAVHAQKEVIIKAGNTGALDFVFNGKKLKPQGDYGEVKTFTFWPKRPAAGPVPTEVYTVSMGLSFLPFTGGGLPFDAVCNRSLQPGNRYPNFHCARRPSLVPFYENK